MQPGIDGKASAGALRRQAAQGRKHEQLQEALGDLDPRMPYWADSFVFGEVWGRDGLSQQERTMVAITALASTGHMDQLRNYLFGAVESLGPKKIHEALLMLVVYVGWPATIKAMGEWAKVRASLGIDLDSVK